MSAAAPMRCVVAYATRDRQWSWTFELPEGATIADALGVARTMAGSLDVPWDSAPVGIFGESKPRSAVLRDGDRVEIYRALVADARERRRQRARHLSGSGGGSSGT